MSTHEQGPSSGGTVIPTAPPNPPCPTCERRMVVRQVMPVLLAFGVDDVIYGCKQCGTEIKQTIKRP